MAGTYSQSILEGKSPQYAYVLVILSGGFAFILSQFGDPVAAWLFYTLLAALFASIWPDKALQWAVWLCLPIFLLICFDVLITGSTYGLWRNGAIFVKALPSACVGTYVGSKLSVRKIATHFGNVRVNRKRVNSNWRAERNSLALKDPSAPVESFKTASSSHIYSSHVQAIERVAKVKDLNAALIKAAQAGDIDSIKLLLAQGADVNTQSREQWTPLMTASLGGDVEMVRTLFGSGAAPDTPGAQGWTALMIATIEGHLEVVRALLESDAQVNAGNHTGWTALRFAVSMDETEILLLLIEAGADVDSVDHEGRTALMQAAEEDIQRSLKALLEGGADPYIKNHQGQTALMIARQHGHTESSRLLKEAQAKAANDIDAQANLLSDEDSYFYLLKEELEEMLKARPDSSQAGDEVAARLLSAIQTLQEHIAATRKERSLAPSEISHKLVLTLREAAALSGLPRHHLLEAIEKRRLKAQPIKHGWRITRIELDAYIRRLS